MNELPSIKPTPEHIIQPHSRFARQDGWRLDDISLCSPGNIAVSGHKYRSSFVCLYSTVDNSDYRDKPTLLYDKEFEDKDSGWRRRISFMEPNSTEIVTCRNDEVQVIDYNRDVVLRSRKVNGKTRCLSVSESQVFIGLLSDIVNIYDKDLNRIKSIRLKGIRGDDCPGDMTAAADRLYVRTARYRAIVYSQNSSGILTEYNTGNNAYSVTVNVQIAVVAVLWSGDRSKRQVAVYSFTDNNCLVVFDVESDVSRIRISDQGRIVTGNAGTGEVKIYDWKQVPFDSLSVRLAQLMSVDEIKELRKHFSISIKDTEVCSVDDEALKSKHVKKLLTILKKKGIFSPNNRNELKALFEKLGDLHLSTSKLIAPILLYQKYVYVYQNDSLQQHQSAVDAGSSNNPFNVSPSHSVPEQSFPNPDNWQNHNLVNVTSTEHGLVCFIRSGKKRGENVLTQLFKLPSAESGDNPQLLYSKEMTRQGYKELFLTFLDGTHLVMCYCKTLEIIDINSNEVIKMHQLSAAARSMSVDEGEIFVVVGHLSKILVFNQNLEEDSTFFIKLDKWKYPTDMTVSSGRLYIICQVRPGQHSGGHNWPVRAMSFRRGDGEMIARYVIPAEEYKPVSITANKESEFVGVLWSVRKVSLHTLSGQCLFVLDVVNSCRIRLLDKTTMVVIVRSDGLKYYNMAHFFTVKALAIRLSHFITENECKSLQSFYGISEEQINGKDSVRRYDVTEVQRRLVLLFKILEENGLVSSNNLDGLIHAVGKSHSSMLWCLVKAFWEVTDKISSIRGASPEVPVQGYIHGVKEDDRDGAASVIHQEAKMELESSNPVDSSPEEVMKDNTESFSEVSLFTNLETKSHSIDDQLTDIEYDRLRELHIDKKSLFIVCLKKKVESWHDNKTFIPWEKSGRWNSTNLFVGCGLTVTDTKAQKDIDGPCKLMYTEIFHHHKLKLERRIIIAGGPGTGKTRLSIQLACDWSEGKIKDVDILIFVPLKFVGGKELVQAIKELYIPAKMPISEQDIEAILASDSEEICVIFDGLERYCPGGGQISRESSEVMKVVNKEIHPTCKVVATTRSGFTEHLQECLLLQIEEFSELERKSYIAKLFPGDIKKQMKMREIIEDDSFLLYLCDVPLLFTLIIHSIESMTITEDIQCDKVAPFVKQTVETLCFSTTVEHESWPQHDTLTLGELAFNGLCKKRQQLSWRKEVLEIKLSNLNNWIESRILFVERDILEKGKDYQNIGEGNLNEEMEQMNKKENDTEEKDNGTNTKTPHMLAQSKVDQCEERKEKSNQGTFSVRFLHKVIQEWFAATYYCSMMKRFTDKDKFHKYIINQLRHINPKDLHYLLRFTCYLHPPSTHAIMNYLLTSYCSKDGDIESYIMDCICLCFTEHNDIRSSNIKSSVEEVCKEVITFDSQDGRLLQQAKSSLLQYASDSGIIIQELLLMDAFAAVEEKSLTLSSGVKLGLLNTLEMVRVSQRYKPLYQDDFANIVKLFTKGKCIKNILCFCPSQPPEPLDEVTMETVFHKNVEVKWNNGYVTWTLDAKKGTFLPEDGQMTKAGDTKLKAKEDMMSYENFLKSQPGTSTSALQKLPMKRYLKKMQLFDMEAESASKQLKIDWDLKSGAKWFKKVEILNMSKDSSMKKASVSGAELVVKEETLAEDSVSKIIKEEIIDSDVEEMVDESEILGGDMKEDIKVGDVMPQEDFLTSPPGTSKSSIEKLPRKQHFSKMQFLDSEAEATAKRLKVIQEESVPCDVVQRQPAECQPPLQTEATITKTGGMLEIPNTGVVLEVPPNALPEDLVQCKIQIKIIGNVMEEDQGASFSSNSATVVELLPDNLIFQHPVRLMLPHCLVFGDTKDHSARIFVSHHRQGDSPQWEEQTHLSYHLEDTTCTIFLNSFCWVKYTVDDRVVTAKKIVVFAAAKKLLQPQNDVATIAVGYYNDLPGKCCAFLQKNPGFIICHSKTYFFRKRKRSCPLQFSLHKILPVGWQGPKETLKDVAYETVASEPGHALFYLLQKTDKAAGNPFCVVTASQKKGQIPVHLAVYPKVENTGVFPSSGIHKHLPQGQSFLMEEKKITQAGGSCEIPDTGVALEIPKHALPADMGECVIWMRIIPSRRVQDEVTTFTSNSSVAVELLPSDLQLQQNVKLTLPHCLKFEENANLSIRIYTKHHNEESQSQWEEQTHLKYRLEDSACIIWMDKLCCVKYAVSDKIVKGKKIVLYTAARKDIQKKEMADVEVGYYPDLPGGGELLRLNPNLITDVMNILYFKEDQNCPLHLSLDSIVPLKLTCCFPEKTTQEIPFRMIAWSLEHSCLYILKKAVQNAGNPVCKFAAIQEGQNTPIELVVEAFSQETHVSQSVTSLSSPGSDSQPLLKFHDDSIKLTIQYLSRNLGPKWKSVGRELGLEEADLYKAEQDNSGIQETIHGMLVCWKQKKGNQATYANLIRSLDRAGRKDLAEKVQNREDVNF